jgi:hypothetical protein
MMIIFVLIQVDHHQRYCLLINAFGIGALSWAQALPARTDTAAAQMCFMLVEQILGTRVHFCGQLE